MAAEYIGGVRLQPATAPETPGRYEEPWQASANCASTDRELFFCDDVGNSKAYREAVAVCHGCVVIDQCLEEHINEKHGIFAGLTPKERATVRRQRRQNQGSAA